MGLVGYKTANEAKVTGSYWYESHMKEKYSTPEISSCLGSVDSCCNIKGQRDLGSQNGKRAISYLL